MQYLPLLFLLLLLATVATAFAIPSPAYIRGPTSGRAPGRVFTKTFTYDSTKDPGDPCNNVNGCVDAEKCFKSMGDLYPFTDEQQEEDPEDAMDLGDFIVTQNNAAAVERKNEPEPDLHLPNAAWKYFLPGYLLDF